MNIIELSQIDKELISLNQIKRGLNECQDILNELLTISVPNDPDNSGAINKVVSLNQNFNELKQVESQYISILQGQN